MNQKSKAEMLKIVDRYYSNAPEYRASTGGIRMNQIGFLNKSYESPMEVATHIVISSFNAYTSEYGTMYTFDITAEMIVSRFGFTSRPSDKVKLVIATIQSLSKKGIIHVNTDVDKIKKNTRFRVFQDMSSKLIVKKKIKDDIIYTTVENNEFSKLISSDSGLTDVQTINCLAVYGALSSSMNQYNPKGHRTGFAYGNRLLNSISLHTYNSIGDVINLAKSSVDLYIHMLIERQVIASIKVATGMSNSYTWSRYYSKYSERIILKEFIKWLIKEGYPETDKLSFVNIKDVWAEKKYPQ